MDELTIRILWPEDKRVPASKIEGWYKDAVANGQVTDADLTAPMDQARALDDAGIITLGPQRH